MKPTHSLGSFNTSHLPHRKSNKFESFNNYNSNLTDNEDSDLEQESFTWKSKPAIWSDDTRMNALFAPFRKRDLNALHYDNKMKFWKEAITSFCKENQIIQLDMPTLESYFIRKKIKPKCLEAVMAELLTEGSFKTRSDALKPKLGVIQNVINKCIWSPLAWSTNFILEKTAISSYIPYRSSSTPNLTDMNLSSISQLSDNTNSADQFVNMNMIEIKSNEFLNLLRKKVVFNNVDCVIEYERIFDYAAQLLNGNDVERDIQILIKYLEVNQKLIVFTSENNKKLVKFSVNNQNVAPVTEIELSYMQLKETEAKLGFEVNKIEDEINSLTETIKGLVKQNNRPAAMKHLKKRKQLEKSLDTKDNTLSNIQAMLMSIQQADTNRLTYDAYNKSAHALKEANKTIDQDKLDDTIQDLQEMMQVNTEIEEAMKSPISTATRFDESELNAELADLLASPTVSSTKDESMDMTDILSSLPNIPAQTPKKSTLAHS